MGEGRFVAYYRVSTQGQGRSGLGLAAQQSAVRAYLDGGRWSLIAEFTEIERGVARLVGIEGGVVSGVFNLESSDVEASDRRPRYDDHYHEA